MVSKHALLSVLRPAYFSKNKKILQNFELLVHVLRRAVATMYQLGGGGGGGGGGGVSSKNFRMTKKKFRIINDH